MVLRQTKANMKHKPSPIRRVQGERFYALARERYLAVGVDVDRALTSLGRIRLSLHCWQGDDVAGFENLGTAPGGLAVTGSYPGKARTLDELSADIEQALELIPG